MRTLGIAEERIYIDRKSGKDFNRLRYQVLRARLEAGDILYLDSLDRLGRDYDGIIHEWKHITRIITADIVVLDNEELFDSRKFRTMGDIGKLLEDQLLSTLA
jgi:DNA invertase Pin-like site-specific DNA recombinase